MVYKIYFILKECDKIFIYLLTSDYDIERDVNIYSAYPQGSVSLPVMCKAQLFDYCDEFFNIMLKGIWVIL